MIRNIRPDEFGQYFEFIDSVFNKPPNDTAAKAKVFFSKFNINAGNIWVNTHKDAIVSSAVCFTQTIGRVKMGSVALVGTLLDCRRHGFMKEILDRIHRQPFDLFGLWTQEPDYFLGVGYSTQFIRDSRHFMIHLELPKDIKHF